MINKFGNAIVLYALIGGPATAHTHTPVITGQRCGRVWITLMYNSARACVYIQNTKYSIIIVCIIK